MKHAADFSLILRHFFLYVGLSGGGSIFRSGVFFFSDFLFHGFIPLMSLSMICESAGY